MKTINVLGTLYTVKYALASEDHELEDRSGQTDFTTKTITIRATTPAEKRMHDAEDMDVFTRSVIRHEIIHAFLYESGLEEYATDETIVSWLSIQFSKLQEAINEADANDYDIEFGIDADDLPSLVGLFESRMPYFKECGKITFEPHEILGCCCDGTALEQMALKDIAERLSMISGISPSEAFDVITRAIRGSGENTSQHNCQKHKKDDPGSCGGDCKCKK